MPAQLKSGKWSTAVLNDRRECRQLVDDTNKLLSDVLKAIQSKQTSSGLQMEARDVDTLLELKMLKLT